MPQIKGYVSLMTATKYCQYSQEYLSLRARQGKLKAVKFGRNWVTKKEWLEEYIMKNPKSEILISKQIPNTKYQIPKFKKQGFRYTLRYNLVVVLMFFFLSFLIPASLIFGKCVWRTISESFITNQEQALKTFGHIGNSIHQISLSSIKINNQPFLAESQENLKESISIFQKFGIWYKEQAATLAKLVRETSSIIGKKIVEAGLTLKDAYYYVVNFIKGKPKIASREPTEIAQEKTVPEEKEGMVVIPSTDRDEQVKEKIKESFSDEVTVEMEDKNSGIITPIFKDGEGEKYLYIMVPIKN